MLIELNYPEPVPVELDAAKTLLLIIDMENENAHPNGALYIGEPVRRIIPKDSGASGKSTASWRAGHPHAICSLARGA